jgi:hypothetical protein
LDYFKAEEAWGALLPEVPEKNEKLEALRLKYVVFYETWRQWALVPNVERNHAEREVLYQRLRRLAQEFLYDFCPSRTS